MFKRTKTLAALAVTAAALVGAGSASAASFGADVKPDVQPSNASEAHPCDYAQPDHKCTWVLNDAYGNAGGEKAPQSGKLRSIKLIAGEAGSFKLQLVKVRGDNSAKVLEQGPRVSYDGQTGPDDGTYDVEKFRFKNPMDVKKGAQIAIVAKKTSTLRCSSGGDNTLLFDPPLTPSSMFTAPSNDDGCWMLIEGNVR